MRDTPHVRGGLLLRVPVLLVGLALFAAGIVALLESQLGLSPWDVLHQGISQHTSLSFGEANVVVSAAVLAVGRVLAACIGFRTGASALLVGTLVQLLLSLGCGAGLSDEPLGVRL